MISFLSRKQKTIGGAAALLGFFTIFAQLLAVLKNKLLSVHFGASTELDIFYTAFKIPDLIFLFIGTMAVGSILIPIFTDKENISVQEKEKFMTRFFNSFAFLIIFASSIVFFFIPEIIEKVFPSYIGLEKDNLIFISRLFLLSPIFMGIANFFTTVNQRNKIFLPMALTGLFYNVAIILGIIFLSPIFGLKGLAYSVIVGAFLYLAIQLPSIIKNNLFKYKVEFLDFSEIKDLLKISFPRSVALSISSLAIFYIFSEISKIEIAGLIVIFTFAYTIFNLPVSLINSSYSPAMLPVIAKFYSQNKIEEFNNTVKDVISKVSFLIIPISFFVFVFSEVVIGAFFSSQKFGLNEINSSAILLSFFALMIPFQVILLVVSKIFYSMGETRPVMWVNIFAGFLIGIFMYIFKYFEINLFNFDFVVPGFEKLFILTFSFIISYILASMFLIWKLKNKIKKINIFDFKNIFIKILISLTAVILTRIIFIYSGLGVEIDFLNNILIFGFFGFIFVLIVLIISEIFKEKNYLDFKGKVLRRVLKK